jgi:dipeptidyl-peptidase-4
MNSFKSHLRLLLTLGAILLWLPSAAQNSGPIHWMKDGSSFAQQDREGISKYTLPDGRKEVILPKERLLPPGQSEPLRVSGFSFSPDETKVLLFTNTRRVWRDETRGDYWRYDRQAQSLRQVGSGRPAASLMFAKFSPDGSQVGYVSGNNLYAEDLRSGKTRRLTSDGAPKHINGTFDWAYEEEFEIQDGFRWSPDSKRIAFWQIDASKIRNHLMVNNTDSIYPVPVQVEYPVAGEKPSPCRIGVVEVASGALTWMAVPGEPDQHYLPRMDWAASSEELLLQQLNRRQNESRLFLCQAATGQARLVYAERDEAWVDVRWSRGHGLRNWLSGGREFLWLSEKDGWSHLYRISRDGKKEALVTAGDFDVIEVSAVDEAGGHVYFIASPDYATQRYLYRARLSGKGKPERVSPASQPGTHRYELSPTARFARHRFSNHYTRPVTELISLPDHKGVNGKEAVQEALAQADKVKASVEFFNAPSAPLLMRNRNKG